MLKKGTICSILYVSRSMSAAREENGEKDTSEATQSLVCWAWTVKNFQETNPKQQFKSKLEGAKLRLKHHSNKEVLTELRLRAWECSVRDAR